MNRYEPKRKPEEKRGVQYSPVTVNLPVRPFLYTLDQIQTLLSMTVNQLNPHLFYQGRSVGRQRPELMIARNVSIDRNDKPDWRVLEIELVRWMRLKGFKYYARGHFTR